MNILRFEMHVPTDVVLESPEGVMVDGRYGPRLRFTLADGRVMYVPPIVGTKIQAQGIGAGEEFQVYKSAVRVGRKRCIEWHVKRGDLEPVSNIAAHEICSEEIETPLERDLRLSTEKANARKTGLAPQRCITRPTHPEQPPPHAPFQHEYTDREETRQAPAQDPNTAPPPATKLEHALKTAISAAHNAERFGSELGYVVRFDADAIKSMAITVLINMSERSPR